MERPHKENATTIILGVLLAITLLALLTLFNTNERLKAQLENSNELRATLTDAANMCTDLYNAEVGYAALPHIRYTTDEFKYSTYQYKEALP